MASASTERLAFACLVITTVITAAGFIIKIVQSILAGLRATIEQVAKEAKERDERSDQERLKTAEGVAGLNATLTQFDKRLGRVESERRR